MNIKAPAKYSAAIASPMAPRKIQRLRGVTKSFGHGQKRSAVSLMHSQAQVRTYSGSSEGQRSLTKGGHQVAQQWGDLTRHRAVEESFRTSLLRDCR